MANYRNHNRDQIEMKLISINDFVPKDHKARLIVSIIEELDLSGFDEYFNNDTDGKKAYPIKDLLALLFYSFSEGVHHTRKIERLCSENIVYRYLCCDDIPDHTTISRFWSRFKDKIEEIFKQTVFIGIEENLIDFKHISGDGVKIKSMGSRNKIINEATAKKRLENIDKQIHHLMKEIDSGIESEEQKKKTGKIEKKRDLKSKIKKRIKRLKEIQSEIKEAKKSGKTVENLNNISITEEDARLIKKRDHYLSCYNAQALADSKTNMIIATDLTNNACDYHNGKPLLENAIEIVGKKNISESDITFDSGFMSKEFIDFSIEQDLDLYVPVSNPENYDEMNGKRNKKGKNLDYNQKINAFICGRGELIPYRRTIFDKKGRASLVYERSCAKCNFFSECLLLETNRKRVRRTVRAYELDKQMIEEDYLDYMRNKMDKNESKNIYHKRSSVIEPVFAHIEEHRGFKRFSVWNKAKVKAQWSFVCTVHNVLKIIKYSNYTQNIVK